MSDPCIFVYLSAFNQHIDDGARGGHIKTEFAVFVCAGSLIITGVNKLTVVDQICSTALS